MMILFDLCEWSMWVGLTVVQLEELRDLTYSSDVPATVGGRARIVLWYAENRPKKEIAAMAGVSRPTVDLWLSRYESDGIAGLLDRKRGAPREQVPARIRTRIPAATRSAPPEGLSHWPSREMVKFIARTERVSVSYHYVAKLWPETGLKPYRQGTFELSRDPRFTEKVADVVGLYLDPPGCAVVLSIDEKTQVQALDRTQPLSPIDIGVTEKRTHDYVRHGREHPCDFSFHSRRLVVVEHDRDLVRHQHPPSHPPRRSSPRSPSQGPRPQARGQQPEVNQTESHDTRRHKRETCSRRNHEPSSGS
jgi:transposase